MSPVLTRHKPQSVSNLGRVAVPIALAVVFVAIFAALLGLVATPDTVDHLTIENRSATPVEVGVSSGTSSDVLWLAGIDAGTTARVAEVLDQGNEWVVRAEHAGAVLGERSYSRDELKDSGWRLTIPADWGQGAGPR
ncbi:MAG: hypothetical protein WEC34_06620 [Acidimicrobiia bacterium]